VFKSIICASLCVSALASWAQADIVGVSQNRFVRSDASGFSTLPTLTFYNDNKLEIASGFTNFNKTVSSSVTGGGSQSNGSASQNSTMTPFVLDVTGASRHFLVNGMGGDTSGSSESHFEIVFDIFYPQNATVTGNIYRNGFAFGSTFLSLTGPSGPLSLPMTGAANNLNLNTTIPLTPGRYTMRATSLAAPTFSEMADERWDGYSMRLSVPVPEPTAASLLMLTAASTLGRRRRDL
jgi:hypothetical protein